MFYINMQYNFISCTYVIASTGYCAIIARTVAVR